MTKHVYNNYASSSTRWLLMLDGQQTDYQTVAIPTQAPCLNDISGQKVLRTHWKRCFIGKRLFNCRLPSSVMILWETNAPYWYIPKSMTTIDIHTVNCNNIKWKYQLRNIIHIYKKLLLILHNCLNSLWQQSKTLTTGSHYIIIRNNQGYRNRQT